MTMPMSLSVASALALIEDWHPETAQVAELAASLLRSVDPNELVQLVPSDVRSLIRIYRRRVAIDSGVIGDHDLLARLEGYPGPQVLAAATSVGGTMVGLWLDDDAAAVIGVVIGQDRRGNG